MGDHVYERGDQEHIGKVIAITFNAVYVRWHKGFCSWCNFDQLVKVEA